MTIASRAYILEDSDSSELLLVVRTDDEELIRSLVRRMSRMRDERLKELGRRLEEDLNGSQG